MPLSLRDLWDSITSRPSRKHLKRQLAAERQRSARLRERVTALEETKATLIEGVAALRARGDAIRGEHRTLVDALIEKDLVGQVQP